MCFTLSASGVPSCATFRPQTGHCGIGSSPPAIRYPTHESRFSHRMWVMNIAMLTTMSSPLTENSPSLQDLGFQQLPIAYSLPIEPR